MDAVPPRMTRRQLVEYLREQGFPVTLHAMNKFCAPARGEGPPVAAFWGRIQLYEPARGLEWAEARLRPVSVEAAEQHMN